MTATIRTLGLVLIWSVIVILAFVVPRFIAPTDFGFTRGMNRLPAILGLHCLGFVVAAVTATLTYRSRAELAKWLWVIGLAPFTLHFLLVATVFLVLFGAAFS